MHRLSQLQATCALPVVATRRSTRINRTGRSLTDEQAQALQLEYQRGGVSTTALGHKYGISQQVAHRIATGRHYANLPTAPARRALASWIDPKVRFRGEPGEPELTALKAMLRDHPERWALVKQTKTMPANFEPWSRWGLFAEARRDADGWWGTYVMFPAGAMVEMAAA